MRNPIEINHKELVERACKPGEKILGGLTPLQADLIHCVMGLSGEAGELLDAVKKHCIYGKPLDMQNVVEEMGDIEFFMERIRYLLNLNRMAILSTNYEKLMKRYPEGYTDKHAQERLDKQ